MTCRIIFCLKITLYALICLKRYCNTNVYTTLPAILPLLPDIFYEVVAGILNFKHVDIFVFFQAFPHLVYKHNDAPNDDRASGRTDLPRLSGNFSAPCLWTSSSSAELPCADLSILKAAWRNASYLRDSALNEAFSIKKPAPGSVVSCETSTGSQIDPKISLFFR